MNMFLLYSIIYHKKTNDAMEEQDAYITTQLVQQKDTIR